MITGIDSLPLFRGILRVRCIAAILASVALCGAQRFGDAYAAQTLTAPPMHRCIADSNGRIDFEGRLGSAGGPSTVRIFATSEASDFYLNGLQSELGNGAQPTPAVRTVEAAENLLRITQKIPLMLANASLAQIVDGKFTCLGFAPGRYSFLAEVHGNGARASDPPLGISFYRADVDVSSLTRHAVVVIQGFRRIGTDPPER